VILKKVKIKRLWIVIVFSEALPQKKEKNTKQQSTCSKPVENL